MKMYEWRSGTRSNGVKAADAGRVLDEIRESEGHVTPRAVVREAEPEESPLHPAFEWDDQSAADLYRMDQARTMIRALVVRVGEGDDTEHEPAFVHVTLSDGASYYQSPRDLISQDSDLWDAALSEMSRRADSISRSVDELARVAARVGEAKKQRAAKRIARKAGELADTITRAAS